MDSLKLAVQGKKVKKLTERRIKIISAFLTKTLKFPQNYDSFATPRWNRLLLKFLCEAKHCKITCLDVKAWLTADCFKQLIHQIRQQEKNFVPKNIKIDCDCEPICFVSSQKPWSNVLEALNLIPRQSHQLKSASSSFKDYQTLSSDYTKETMMTMKTTAAQALLMLNYTDNKYHDKNSSQLISSSS